MSKLKDKQFRTKGELWPFLRRLLKYAFRYPKWLAGFAICVLLVSASEAIIPLVWRRLLDDIVVPAMNQYKLSGAANTDLRNSLPYIIMMMLLGVVIALSVFGFIRFAGRIQEFVMYDLREALFVKLQELSFSFYDKSAVGWLLSRISSDTNKVTELISWNMIEAIWGIGMIIFCGFAMMFINWKLASIVLLVIPLLIVISIRIRMLILRHSREARRYNSEITARYNEHLNGVEVNKSLVQEERVSAEFRELSERMRQSSYQAAFYTAVFTPLVIGVGSFASAIVIYYGGNLAAIVPAEISVGTFAAFIGYAAVIWEPIFDISRFYAQAQGSISAGERIFSLLDTQPMIVDKPDAAEFKRIKGNIEFSNISFCYDEGKPVLNNLDLSIKAGESIALVGETGGGKSTIINLICRFYEPTDGVVKIDGIDYKEMTKESLRSQLGVVLQTPHLFSGTVRDNITYGRESATETELIDALVLVGAEDFMDRLDEQVGEGGENLSMGEKQLISFARAVLADPRIFIMDEATSSVDTITETRIQNGIYSLMEGRTSIIIAHRLSTIKHCDRILVVNRGKIIEDGNHYELMKQHGYYHNLYTRQLREQREREVIG